MCVHHAVSVGGIIESAFNGSVPTQQYTKLYYILLFAAPLHRFPFTHFCHYFLTFLNTTTYLQFLIFNLKNEYHLLALHARCSASSGVNMDAI